MPDLYQVKRMASLLIDAINCKNECRAEDEFHAGLSVEAAIDDLRDILWPERKAMKEALKTFAELADLWTCVGDDHSACVDVGDLRRAARVLHGEEKVNADS